MVVALEPLARGDITEFLTAATPARARWSMVLAQLGEPGESALGAALSSPLMVSLARSVYAGTGTDPADLLDSRRFPDRASIERHLLGAFPPAAYNTAPSLSIRSPTYEQAAAYRWLAFLAATGPEIAWWQLYRRLPRYGLETLAALTCGLIAGPVVGLVASAVFGAKFLPMAGIGVSLGVGSAAALVTRLERRPSPSRVRLRISGHAGEVRRAMAAGLGAGVIGGTLFGTVFWLVAGFAAALGVGLVAGLVAGLAGGAGVGLLAALREPIEQTQVASPRLLLRADRAGALAQSCLGGLASAIAVGLVAAPLARPEARMGVVSVASLGVGLGVFLVAICNSAWGRWQLSRGWLTLIGKVPWSLIEFLEDGHSRGILRQTGGVYEFRHALLQECLAEGGPDS
jgi:hypothetical protein